MIRVLICDDQEMVREGLAAILKTAPGIQVVGAARDGEEALARVAETRPDIVLMDLKMPGVNGIQATRQIREKHPAVRILVLTTYDHDEWVFDAIRAGATGYLLKDTPRERLVEAIQGTALGKSHVAPEVASKLFAHVTRNTAAPDPTILAPLSERERDALRLLARGLSNSDIAKRLFLSEGTVRNYMTSIFEKLGVADRTQAALVAVRHGLLDGKEP